MKVKKLLMTFIVFVISHNLGYCQLYSLKKRKYVLDQEEYSKVQHRIESAKNYEDLPQKWELVATQNSPIYTWEENKQNLKKTDRKIRIGKLLTGKVFETRRSRRNWNWGDIEVISLGIKHIEKAKNETDEVLYRSTRYSTLYNFDQLATEWENYNYISHPEVVVLLEGTINEYVYLKHISENRHRKRSNSDVDLFHKKIQEDWRKGYNLLDVWIDKVRIIRKNEVKKIIQEGKEKQQAIKDSIRREEEKQQTIRREEERKQQIIKNRKRKERLIKKFGKDKTTTILAGKVSIGFTKEMCINAWGRPQDINKTTTSFGVHEQWVYSLSSYSYFDDGVLTSIQN